MSFEDFTKSLFDKPECTKRLLLLEFIRNFPMEIKLKFYYEFYKSLPSQDTEEWKLNRRIGASDAASILGCSPFANKISTAKRLLYKTFEKSAATEWGKLMEPIVKLYLSNYIEILEFGSIPGFGNPIMISCSPDGVFIMTDKLLNKFNLYDCKKDIHLLEIKCPYKRMPKGEIPDHYLPQLYLSMQIINITTAALFCDCQIEVLTLNNFNFKDNPLAIGIIIFENLDVEVFDPVETNDDLNNVLPELTEIDYIQRIKKIANIKRKLKEMGKNNEQIWQYLSQFEDKEFLNDFLDMNVINNSSIVDLNDLYSSTYRWTNESILLKNKKINYLGQLSEYTSPYECIEFAKKQISTFSNNKNIYVYCYQLRYMMTIPVEKKDYKPEILKLIEFGKKVEEIKSLPQIEWDINILGI